MLTCKSKPGMIDIISRCKMWCVCVLCGLDLDGIYQGAKRTTSDGLYRYIDHSSRSNLSMTRAQAVKNGFIVYGMAVSVFGSAD